MIFDCAIIGGGPAGLNAALVLGRARRRVVLFDDNKPRNAVTRESHGFITRDGISPGEFRRIGREELGRYDSIEIRNTKVDAVTHDEGFRLVTQQGEKFQARKIILASGLKEVLPCVEGIRDYYGKSLFSCPYCDGWELRDKPLIVVSENENAFHMAKTVYNWSRDVAVCTNGRKLLTPEQREVLRSKNIRVYEQKIVSLAGDDGLLEEVSFEDGSKEIRSGGFVTPSWEQASSFAQELGCTVNEMGGIITDGLGRTNVKDVYAAGDTSVIAPSQLIIAAAGGSRAAIGVNSDLTSEEFGG